MSKKKMIQKIFSVFLTLVVLLMCVPIAFATTVALSSSNITTWPTATYINGETMYFGQKIEDAVTLTGGTVEYNGVSVAGHFEFIDPSSIPTSTGNKRADIKFIPDDVSSFVGFEAKRCRNVTYTVSTTTPIFKDEVNNPLIATEVEAGATLSTSTLSGGTMINPYNAEEANVLAATWAWVSPDTVVQESGYFEAVFYPIGYTRTTTQVYVKVASDVPNSAIETMPTINVTYAPDLTWGEVAIEGGKAVIKDSTTEVEGSFAVTDKWINTAVKVGTTEIDIKFTPADDTVALPCEFKCPVTVNKAVPTFKANSDSDVPTITMSYGTKLDSSLDTMIKSLIDVNVPVSLAYKDLEGNDLSYSGTTPTVGTHEIQILVGINDSNYEKYTMLTFNLEITGFTANCIMVPVGTEGYKIIDESLAYNATKPTGTFTVLYTINGEKQTDKTVKYGELFQVDKNKSGKYEYSIKYNEIENDPFEIDSFTFSSEEKLDRNVKIGDSSQKYTYGDKVTAVAPATDPSMPDKPYYGFAGWEAKGIELTDEQISSPEITFDMPDEDVELNSTYKFSMKLFFEWIWQQIVQFFTFFINAMKDLFALSVA